MNKEVVKEQIISILGTYRYDMSDLISYLGEDTDFFEAPASTRHHNVFMGGLAEHSLNVYRIAVTLDRELGAHCVADHLKTAALLHDVCKANYYVREPKWRKDDCGKWESYMAWAVNDQLPIGHGEKSLYLVGKFVDLDDDEAAAIRWHMGAWTPGVTSDYGTGMAFNVAIAKYPLVGIIVMADFAAARMADKRGGE